MLRALSHRNYRLFFAGQGVSLVGTWITRVATSWLVYRLTGSAALLGLVGFAGQIPTFFLAPFAGRLGGPLEPLPRAGRRRRSLAMLQSFALAALALSGAHHGLRTSCVLSAFQGVINAFDTPARQAFVVEMVEDRADLPNAIALNSSHGQRGPAGRPLDRRRADRGGRGGRGASRSTASQLPRGDRLAAGDAPRATGAPGRGAAARARRARARASATPFGFAPIRAAAPAARPGQPRGDALHRADAGVRRARCCTAGRTPWAS